MIQAEAMTGLLWVERVAGLGEAGVWIVTEASPEMIRRPDVKSWLASAEGIFSARSEIASVSMVDSDRAELQAMFKMEPKVSALQAGAAALPLCFLSGKVAELVGLDNSRGGKHSSPADFRRWIETATIKGLVHLWLAIDLPASEDVLSIRAARSVPAIPLRPDGRFVPFDLPGAYDLQPKSFSVGIDAAWLLGGESGAQVFVFEMLKELAHRAAIEHIVLFSDTGDVPRALHDVPKVRGVPWVDALARATPLVDILHRPYQPDARVDYRRYHRVARCVAITVLDFIAYDNPAYHDSSWSWRQYQRAFDENVCIADCVFAISRHIGSRLERQFSHQLSGPVRSVPLAADHRTLLVDPGLAADISLEVKRLVDTPFLLVLGNDFEHKNRDFAVRVFCRMRSRGYAGHLVLAGFHLDHGSSFGHELSGADNHVDWIRRIGAVSAAEKGALLRCADVVLYPTSSEGFGLVPFEAAALGTPTAFVKSGALRETLPAVDACIGWQVDAFADLAFRLIADPEQQIEQIRAAGAAFTWTTHVDQILDSYQTLLSNRAPWRTRTRELPGPRARASRAVEAFAYRAVRKVRNLAGMK